MAMEKQMSCQSYGIFWDIENCAIPSLEKAANVVQRVKEFIATKFEKSVGRQPEPCVFICSCDTRTLDTKHVEALNRYGVDILHVNSTRNPQYKVNADIKLMECMSKFTDHHMSTNPVFLITGDIDFAPAIRSAKRHGFQVILLYGHNTSEDLKNLASESHSYIEVIAGADRESPMNIIWSPSAAPNSSTAPSVPQQRVSDFLPNLSALLGPKQSSASVSMPTVRPATSDVTSRSQSQPKRDRNTGGMVQFDENKLKKIQEVTEVERHVALRMLEITCGDVDMAIVMLTQEG